MSMSSDYPPFVEVKNRCEMSHAHVVQLIWTAMDWAAVLTGGLPSDAKGLCVQCK